MQADYPPWENRPDDSIPGAARRALGRGSVIVGGGTAVRPRPDGHWQHSWTCGGAERHGGCVGDPHGDERRDGWHADHLDRRRPAGTAPWAVPPELTGARPRERSSTPLEDALTLA